LLLVMPSSGTLNFNRRGIMKKSILILIASILLSYPISLMGAGSETPHEFKAGDTISADMMNEIFDYINNANKMISASELIGTWSCSLYTAPTGECTWTVGTESLHEHSSSTLVMIDDGDGTYSYTAQPNMFLCETDLGFGIWIVKNNVLFIVGSAGGVAGDPSGVNAVKLVNLKKVSNTKLLMEFNPALPRYAECDRQNLPPNSPSSLTSDNSSSSITLTWTDNQTEAVTGYKVIRKTVVTDDFTTVSTITDNTTRTYADDNVSTGGTYWYRVRAYNSNGDGTPSMLIGPVQR
jgi:hypothetical protein